MTERRVDAAENYEKALSLREAEIPPVPSAIAQAAINLGVIYQLMDRFSDAELQFKKALYIFETTPPPDLLDYAIFLAEFANFYLGLGEIAKAEEFLRQASEIDQSTGTRGQRQLSDHLNDLGLVYFTSQRYAAAENEFSRSIELLKSVGAPKDALSHRLNNMAMVYSRTGRIADAISFYEQALEVQREVLGAKNPMIATTMNNLANSLKRASNFDRAERLLLEALEIRRETIGVEHLDVAESFQNLASLKDEMHDNRSAVVYSNSAVEIVETRLRRNPKAANKAFIKSHKIYFDFNLALLGRSSLQNLEVKERAFRSVQWLQQSAAASAMNLMAARAQTSVIDLVQEQERLTLEVAALSEGLRRQMSKSLTGRNREEEKFVADRLRELERRVDDLTETIKNKDPKYANLVSPAPLAIADVQHYLNSNEVLLVAHLSELGSSVFAIGKGTSEWRLIDDPRKIGRQVATLRCGLDVTEWNTDRANSCLELVGVTKPPEPSWLLPFRLDTAHELYEDIVGSFKELIRGKHVIVVVDGALAALPFQVLVTEKPGRPVAATVDGYRGVSWFGVRQPLSVLPSVASLFALRALARAGVAPNPFIGFGNPLLVGRDGTDFRSFQINANVCSSVIPQDVAPTNVAGSNGRIVKLGAGTDIEEVRRLAPVPETSRAVCGIATSLGGADKDIYLGAKATEAMIKDLNASGVLAQSRIIVFATHALLPGNNTPIERGLPEPALVLTPPPAVSDKRNLAYDDGLLTASEVVQLKLNADWVVLSACNTAGGEKFRRGGFVRTWPSIHLCRSSLALSFTLGSKCRCGGQNHEKGIRRNERPSRDQPCRSHAPSHLVRYSERWF